MKHNYDETQLTEAYQAALKEGSCGDTVADYMSDFLDALPEPATDDWQACEFSDIRKGDRVKRVMKNSDGTITTIEGPATFHHLTGWGTCDHYLADREDDSQDNITLYRIPAPVVHPDPLEYPVIIDEMGEPWFWAGLDDDYHSPTRPSTFRSPSDFTVWTPGKVVEDDR